MTTFKMIAKTFKGLEDVLAQELMNLGAENVQTERRAVSFEGNLAMLYRANFCLRTASRVLMPIATFSAADADAVYEQVKNIKWEEYMAVDTTFAIDSTVYSDTFRHSQYVTYRVKDAIADWWMDKAGKRPSVRVSNPDLYINVHIAQETVTVSLDSSGESLHKRGWREEQTAAPINEALAAGMLLMAGWHGQCDFVDPMCGSGTFLVEAAMIALNIAPGIFRQSFAFEKWKNFDRALFEDIYNDDSDEREFTHHIYGSDASFYAIRVAEKNIKSAGLQKYVTCKQIRLQELQPFGNQALIVMNPPYGERIGIDKDIFQLYDEIGTTLKHKFAGSTAWIISSNEDALKHIGLKPTKRYQLLNGELECHFNEYDLFAGERKDHVISHPRKDFDRKEDSERKPRKDSKPRKDFKEHKDFRKAKDFAEHKEVKDNKDFKARNDGKVRSNSSRREWHKNDERHAKTVHDDRRKADSHSNHGKVQSMSHRPRPSRNAD